MSNKKHEKYKPNEKFDKKNDIVLLILNEMVQFTNEIQPACLPFEQIIRADVPKIGQTGLTAGWGVVKNSVFTSTILQSTSMTVSDCKNIQQTKNVLNQVFCSTCKNFFNILIILENLLNPV